ncbi:Ionotropic glutamate receptor L-glutamate and glycine-binding domain [Trinorchestia longiramus]|nr:Ionotropic glutamate receptor L-glutamate and glycine-binding domain [Trinorchestia longiramus]
MIALNGTLVLYMNEMIKSYNKPLTTRNLFSSPAHQLGRLVSESACERKDPGLNPAADMVDAARNTAWDLGFVHATNYLVSTTASSKLAMDPHELLAVVCSLAVTRSCSSVQLVTASLEGYNSSCSRQFSLLLARHCPTLSSFLQPQVLSSFEVNISNFNVYPPPEWQHINTLFVLPLQSLHDILRLSEFKGWDLLSRLPWLLVCSLDLFNTALDVLPWRLDNKVQILVNGESEPYIWEAYRPSPTVEARGQRLAAATVPLRPSEQLLLASDPWPRRDNLTHFVLRCGTLPYLPFSELTTAEDGKNHLGGLLGDFLDALQGRLQFQVECSSPDDGLWGTEKNSKGEYVGGLFGDLLSGRIDVAASTFIFSPERLKIVQFTYPLTQHWAVIILQKPKLVDASNNYTREFTSGLWLAAAAAFCCCVVIRYVFARYYDSHRLHSFSSSVMETVRTFCNMGIGEEESTEKARRIFSLTMLLTVMMMHVSYSSFLITMLSSNQVILPFQDLVGLYARRDDYSFGIEADTYHYLQIKEAQSGILHAIYQDMVEPHLEYVEAADDGTQRVLSDPRHAFMVVFVKQRESHDEDAQQWRDRPSEPQVDSRSLVWNQQMPDAGHRTPRSQRNLLSVSSLRVRQSCVINNLDWRSSLEALFQPEEKLNR